MEMLLIRHGEPDWFPNGHLSVDPGLSEYGRNQAELLAGFLVEEGSLGFHVSPLRRALETAAPFKTVSGCHVRVEPWLAEIDRANVEGQSERDFFLSHSRRRARPLGDWWAGNCGESLDRFFLRVSTGLAELLASHYGMEYVDEHENRIWLGSSTTPNKIAFLAHAGSISAILAYLLQLSPVPWALERFYVEHTGVTRLKTFTASRGELWAMSALNERANWVMS